MKRKQINRGAGALSAAVTLIMGFVFLEASSQNTQATRFEAPATSYITKDIIQQPSQEDIPESNERLGEEPLVKPNTIGFNGIFLPFLDMGPSTTADVQTVIDAGYIAASTTFFNPTDGNTTYFSGHNPGVFGYFAMDFHVGGIVTVVDEDGTSHDYILMERVALQDTKDVQVQNSYTGLSVGEIYTSGSGQESIAIQFCQGPIMYQWYAAKM